MKRILQYISVTVLCAAAFSGCTKDVVGEGYLSFTVGFDGKVATRADAPENCNVKVATADGKVVYEYADLAEIPAKLWLTTGDYIVVAEGGTKVVSGWDAPFYKGSETFTIKAGETTPVAVVCTLQNALFTVGFDESVTVPMTGYSATLSPLADDDSHDLVFDENNIGATGYVMPSKSLTSVGWAFTAEHKDYGTVAKTGTIAIEARKKYEITFKYTPKTGIFDTDFTITVIEEPIEELSHNIPLFQRPKLTGVGFDLSIPQLPADQYEIAATASSDITRIVLTGSIFGEQGIDLLADDLTGTGVRTVTVTPNAVSIFLTSELFDKLGGSNVITITVTDAKDKTNSADFEITASGIDPVAGTKNIWATFVNVSGTVLEEGTSIVRFAYRPAGGGDWEYVNGTESAEGKYTARIAGLSPSSPYQVALEVNGRIKGNPVAFTTDIATQMPNSYFEEWRTRKEGGIFGTSNVKFPDDGTTKFWDSANKGLGTDITYDSPDVRAGRAESKSAYMKSTTYMSIFAAGNLYTGQFKGISGLSAEVNFGQPFNARPSALKGWYKAAPGSVTHDDTSKVPHLPKGATDEYQIYVLLTNWTGQRIVNPSKAETLINFSADYVIGFGQITDVEKITGSEQVADWTEFNIPIKYKSYERPSYIVVVACASKYGDYFVGSTSSVLQVDDFELIYDDNIVLQD